MVLAAREAPARHVVKVAVEPFRPEHEPAAEAFNERMRRAGASTAFLLPTKVDQSSGAVGVRLTQYIARDDAGHVRGGILGQEHPALVGGRLERTVNLQAPLSEGIVDRTYAFVAPQLVKHIVRQTPHAFVVGMGSAELPFPRLLKAMQWRLAAAPFYFRLLRPARCFRQLAPLRTSAARRLLGHVAVLSGAAAVAERVAHRATREVQELTSRFTVEPVRAWDDWADEVWSTFAQGISFGVPRTRDLMPWFYPLHGRSPRAWALKRNGRVEGWFGLAVTAMSKNAYFGDLTVATLTDCVGSRDAVRAGMACAAGEARAAGADILVTNQQHHVLQDDCRAAGWREAPSNFLIATSPALSAGVDERTAYVTRRDGDGLTNLM
jgi:hypothetical protein